jgi:hypothetical protein
VYAALSGSDAGGPPARTPRPFRTARCRPLTGPIDYPAGKAGDVLTVEFSVPGIPCLGLNGGPEFRHSEALSFQIATDDQARRRPAHRIGPCSTKNSRARAVASSDDILPKRSSGNANRLPGQTWPIPSSS